MSKTAAKKAGKSRAGMARAKSKVGAGKASSTKSSKAKGAKGKKLPARKAATKSSAKSSSSTRKVAVVKKTVSKTKPAGKKVTPKKPIAKLSKKAVAVASKSTRKSTSTGVAKKPSRSSGASQVTKGSAKSMASRGKVSDIVLPAGYKPSEDEPFMNDLHRAYFRKRLIDWKDEILRQTRETLAILHEDSSQHADLADRATSETDRATELRTRDRQRKLIAKIDAALARIEDGSYGFCEDTGEPIGIRRLDARPIATLSVEAQERHERRERVYREE